MHLHSDSTAPTTSTTTPTAAQLALGALAGAGRVAGGAHGASASDARLSAPGGAYGASDQRYGAAVEAHGASGETHGAADEMHGSADEARGTADVAAFAAPAPAARTLAPTASRAVTREASVLTQGRCDTHGAYPLNTIDADGTLRWHSPGCPGCRRDRGAQGLVSRAAIAPRFAHCTFDNYDVGGARLHGQPGQGAAGEGAPAAASPKPAASGHSGHSGHSSHDEERRLNRDACRAYARDFARMRAQGACLVLRGAPGTGKNHLATAIARELLARGYSVLNATAHDVIRRIRDTWGHAPGEKDERAVLRELAAVDLLIIDEAGRHYGARDGRDNIELFQVIDARYRALMPTLVISNLERDAMRAAIGEAAFDRLREGGGQMLHFDWPSYRGRATPHAAPDPLAEGEH